MYSILYISQEAKKFADRIIGIVTSFADDALYAVSCQEFAPSWTVLLYIWYIPIESYLRCLRFKLFPERV